MIRLFFVCLLVLSQTTPARAADAAAELLTLEQVVQAAKERSPEIKSLQSQLRSAEAKARQALSPNEPTLGLTYNDLPSAFQLHDPASVVVQIQEQIGFPGKAFLNRSALSSQARAVAAQLRATELQVSAAVRAAYLQLVLARKNLELNQEQQESYQRILEITKRRYAAGAIPQVDLLNAQVAFYSNNSDLNDLRASERSAAAQLNVLLGNPVDKNFRVDEIRLRDLPLPARSEVEAKMVESRSELKAARSQLEAANSTYKLSKMSVLPDFQFSLGMTDYRVSQASPWVSAGAANAPTYTYSAGVQITVPLFAFFNEGEGMRAAAADRAAAEANLQTTLNQSRVSLTSTLETLAALKERIQNAQDHLLPLSEQALTLALINYSAGKIDFQTLVDTANSRRNVKRDYLTSVSNYLTNYSLLGQLLGEEQ